MKINLSDLFSFNQPISPLDQEVMANQLIDDFRNTSQLLLPQYTEATYYFEPYGYVAVTLKQPVFFIDPFTENLQIRSRNNKFINALYNEYLQQEEKNFQLTNEIDPARIWPKFHYVNNHYCIFTRFGYIYNRTDHTSGKESYQLEFSPTSLNKENNTATLADQLKEAIAISSADQSIALLQYALQKIPPTHFAQFKSTLNMHCLAPFTHVHEAQQFFAQLRTDALQTHKHIVSTQALIHKYLLQLDTAYTSPSKQQLIQALNNQAIEFTQPIHLNNFDDWCLWQIENKRRYGEESIINKTLNWLLTRFAIKKPKITYPFTPLQPKEPMYDCIKTLCNANQDIDKLHAIVELMQYLTPDDVNSFHQKLNVPLHINLQDFFVHKINELRGPTPGI